MTSRLRGNPLMLFRSLCATVLLVAFVSTAAPGARAAAMHGFSHVCDPLATSTISAANVVCAAASRVDDFARSLGSSARGSGFLHATEDGAGAADNGSDVTFGHGARHLAGTGLDQGDVEAAIEAQVEDQASRASLTSSFWGRVEVDGQTIDYRAYTRPNGTINVGTYYVP